MLVLIFREDTKLFIFGEIFILLTFQQFRYLTAPVYLGLSYTMCKNSIVRELNLCETFNAIFGSLFFSLTTVGY